MLLTDAESKEFYSKYKLLEETLTALDEINKFKSWRTKVFAKKYSLLIDTMKGIYITDNAAFKNYLIGLAKKTIDEIHNIIYENLPGL